MPKIPIDEVPAGPEMDAAIARALGCNVTIGKREGRQAAFCNCESREHENPITYVSRMLKRYSQDIEAAWELVEVMHQKVRKINNIDELDYLHLNFVRDHWQATFGWEIGYIGIADTARLAICRAFLKASGVEHVEVPE